jgi:type VI secretion system protein ImpG
MGVLRLTLKTQSKTVGWDKLRPDRLRFFLRGPSNDALRLYELILNDVSRVRSVVIADSADDHHPLVLDASAIQPVGFEADEGMIPYPPRSSIGYRLLTEYFAFPEKFLFFDINGIANKTSQLVGDSLDIFIYVDRWSTDLERAATKDSLALGCTPIVNLFTQRAEPIALSDTSVEYRIIPDSRRPGALEVYSVDKVSITSQAGENITLHPLFGLTHAAACRGETRFWHATRRPSGDGCSDTFLSLVDLDGDPFSPSDWVASIEATCTNRDLAGKLPFGGGHPHLRLNREQPGVGVISCLVAPRAPLGLPNRKQSAWRLISHLTLNHLSLIDQETGPAALREILRLYDFRDAAETRAMIDSMTGIEFRRGTARAPSRQMGVLCRGLDITMQFDDQVVSGVGVFLFASVLERFIAHYASINAFTRLTAKVKGRSGVLRTWPPRAGDLQIL